MNTPSETERTVVEAARAALRRLKKADSSTIAQAMSVEGISIQPWDLEFVLQLHPTDFWKGWAGDWTLLGA